ncbi:type IV secretion system protein [Vibrio vulnificus]
MKKFIKKVLPVALAASIGVSAPVNATGIPTIDVAAIAQMIQDGLETAKRFREQMKEVRQQINVAQNHTNTVKNLNEGNYHDEFLDVLADPEASSYLGLEDWSQIYNDLDEIEKLRKEFGLWGDMVDSDSQKRLDIALYTYSFMEKSHKKSVERQKRIEKMQRQYQLADNPAKKADLQNALQYEQLQMENDKMLIANMESLMNQESELQRRQTNIKQRQKLLSKDW